MTNKLILPLIAAIIIVITSIPSYAAEKAPLQHEITEFSFNGKDILKSGNWRYTDDAHYEDFGEYSLTAKPKKLSAALEARKRRSMSSRSAMSHKARRQTDSGSAINITPSIIKYAKKHDVNPHIIRAIIEIESGFNPNAVSCSGACGLMQLKPATAKEMGITDYMDPDKNIEAGTKYIKYMLTKFHKLDIALAAYNQGPGTVERAGRRIPNGTARHYVKKFHKALNK